MAEFLITSAVTHHLVRLIRGANERLILISPYFKVNQRLKELIEDKAQLGVEINVVYGKGELHPEERRWLDSMSSVKTAYRPNLHAKCYMNENEAILTSMNLYEYSQVNNDEMGILITSAQEPELSKKFWLKRNRFLRNSDVVTVNLDGFCIRCKTTISHDREKPNCGRCYNIWKRFNNDSYPEKHCHACGKQRKSTMLKPICRKCRRKLAET